MSKIESFDTINDVYEPSVLKHLTILYDPTMTIKALEKAHINNALSYFNGNKTLVAKSLGFTLKTLYNKLEEYQLSHYINKRVANVNKES